MSGDRCIYNGADHVVDRGVEAIVLVVGKAAEIGMDDKRGFAAVTEDVLGRARWARGIMDVKAKKGDIALAG